MNHILSLVIPTSLGFLGVNLLRAQGRIDPLVHVIASIGLGLTLSAQIIFYTLFIFGEYNPTAVVVAHGLILIILIIANIRTFTKDPTSLLPKFQTDRTAWLGFMVLTLLLVPLWREAHFFPFGGWDAWACWNLKAKFIYLGGDGWKQMLDVSMWRSNNQYPFLLPLMNVWGWSLTKDTSTYIPMTHAILFTFLTALMMFWAAKQHTRVIATKKADSSFPLSCFKEAGSRNEVTKQSQTSSDEIASTASRSRNDGIYKLIYSVIPALVLFTIPFVNTLSISQYSDIVLAFFLLGTLTTLTAAREDINPAMAALAGLFCGAMCFTKSEGAFAAVVIAGLAGIYLKDRPKGTWTLLGPFLTATVLSALPAILFQLFWATPNISFINGLTSTDHPVTLDRLKAITMFLALEFVSPKWNGLWILLICGSLLAGTRVLKNGFGIVAAFLGIYLSGALVFYSINTHYEILWWLGATLNRILYTILPVVVWWVFAALWDPTPKK